MTMHVYSRWIKIFDNYYENARERNIKKLVIKILKKHNLSSKTGWGNKIFLSFKWEISSAFTVKNKKKFFYSHIYGLITLNNQIYKLKKIKDKKKADQELSLLCHLLTLSLLLKEIYLKCCALINITLF